MSANGKYVEYKYVHTKYKNIIAQNIYIKIKIIRNS